MNCHIHPSTCCGLCLDLHIVVMPKYYFIVAMQCLAKED